MVFEHAGDLEGEGAGDGEVGDLVLGEEIDAGGFVAFGGSASGDLAEEEELVYVDGDKGEVGVLAAVVDGGELGDADFET